MYVDKIKELKQITMTEAKNRMGEITDHFKKKDALPIILTLRNRPYVVIQSIDNFLGENKEE